MPKIDDDLIYEKSHRIYKFIFNDIVFRNSLTMKYYQEILHPQIKSGNIVLIEINKSYTLQSSYNFRGEIIPAVNYIVDFYIKYKDDKEEIIDIDDVKQKMSREKRLKRKLFHYLYPNFNYYNLGYIKSYGGWNDCAYIKKSMLRKKKYIRYFNTQNTDLSLDEINKNIELDWLYKDE